MDYDLHSRDTLLAALYARDAEIEMLKVTIADLRTIAKSCMQEGESLVSGETLTDDELNTNLNRWLNTLVTDESLPDEMTKPREE